MTNRAGIVREFIGLNQALSAAQGNASQRLLVDAAYRDPYIVTCAMKVAACAAALIDADLIVIVGPGITREAADIVRSFNPARVVSIRDLAKKGARTRLGRIMSATSGIRTGDDLVSLTWEGALVGPHLYDTFLMRWGLPSIDRLTLHHRLHLFLELCILEGFRKLVETSQPAMAVLPDNVYRAGGFFDVLAAKRIPMLAGLDVNGLALHYYSGKASYSSHCRTPDRAMVELVSRTPELMERAEAYLRSRTSGREAQHDVQRAFRDDDVYLDRKRLCGIMQFSGTKPLVLVAAHVFSDAPHAYRGLLFRDYEVWLRETCRLLRANPDVDFFVKEHPSAELYSELGLTRRLLAGWGVSPHFLPVRANTRSLFDCVDTVITCGGTAGAEFPCFGVPVLLAAGAPYDELGYVRRAHSVEEYASETGRLQAYKKLSAADVQQAKAALFVMQAASRVPKAELGLGTQPFMKGADFDFELFLREAANDLRDGSGNRRLSDALRRLLDGPYENMIDTDAVATAVGMGS